MKKVFSMGIDFFGYINNHFLKLRQDFKKD